MLSRLGRKFFPRPSLPDEGNRLAIVLLPSYPTMLLLNPAGESPEEFTLIDAEKPTVRMLREDTFTQLLTSQMATFSCSRFQQANMNLQQP